MKRGGTLKVEIVKPLDESWAEVGARMRALRQTLQLALNFAFRDVSVRAMTHVEQVARREKPDTKWLGDVPKRIQFHWGACLARQADWLAKKRKSEKAEPISARVFAPPCYSLCGENADYITSRFAGEHFRDLLSGRAGVPQFNGGKAFYAEGRACAILGLPTKKPDEKGPQLCFPLWGSGRKATRFAVAPCGDSHLALWRRLVESQVDREGVIALTQTAKKGAGDERKRALFELESRSVIKMGRIGIKYDERKGKWYALISWTEYLPSPAGNGIAAACRFGLNRFIAALTENGESYEDAGADILATRTRYQQRRRSLQKHNFHRGSGARGRGVKRREKAITDLGNAESRWVRSRIQTAAADFTAWCVRHKVGTVYFEEMTGLRESFERLTSGDAAEELKRWIHNWAFYETQSAFQRQLEEFGIAVEKGRSRSVLRKCPRAECGNVDPQNVSLEGGEWEPVSNRYLANVGGEKDGDYRVIAGTLYQRVRKRTVFQCTKCRMKGDGDTIACANHLLEAGKTHALEKKQEAAKKTASATLKNGVSKAVAGATARKPARKYADRKAG